MIRIALLAAMLAGSIPPIFAQPKSADVQVILLADTAQFGISPAELIQTHGEFAVQLEAMPDPAQQPVRRSLATYNKSLSGVLMKLGNTLQSGLSFRAQVFYRADGTAEWVIIEPSESTSVQEIGRLLTSLTTFYRDNILAVSMPKPFVISSAHFLGKSNFAVKRTVRTGDSTISTLEAARLTNRPDTVKYVFFNQLNLKTVPTELYRFPNVEEVDLSKNELTELPLRLTADLPKLKRLSLLANEVDDNHMFFAKNTHLEALNVQYNKLTHVPKSISKNRHLGSLWLGHNTLIGTLSIRPLKKLKRLYDLNLYEVGLTSVPRKIWKLKHLTILDLYHNELTTLPKQMGKMKALEQLAVANNNLTELPKELAKLPRLAILFAHHNKLTQLPAEMASLTNLRLLDIGTNQFSELPPVILSLPALEDLDLSKNNIQTLPSALAQLTKLKKLYMRSNPITKDDAKVGPYARVIDQLEANKTEVFY